MNVFIIGMPGSGRTTLAQSICNALDYQYVNAFSWIKSSFREKKEGEGDLQFHTEFYSWLTNRMKSHPNLVLDNLKECMSAYGTRRYVIDGLFSPRDFSALFDYNKDMVVFADRTNNSDEFKDHETIGVSVMRDHCFWMSAADLLPKERWIEFKYQIPGDPSSHIRLLGSKNTVYICRNIEKAEELLIDRVRQLTL